MDPQIATVALCKCLTSHKMYGVRFKKIASSQWKYTWAFPVSEGAARREGYDEVFIDGMIESDPDYPGCPYCGAKFFVVCSCGRLNCNAGYDEIFTCEWCGDSGYVEDYDGSGFHGGNDY